MSSDRQEGMEGAIEIIPVVRIELKHLLSLPSTYLWGNSNICTTTLIYYYCELWNTTIVRLDRGGFIGNYKNSPDSETTLLCLSKVS